MKPSHGLKVGRNNSPKYTSVLLLEEVAMDVEQAQNNAYAPQITRYNSY